MRDTTMVKVGPKGRVVIPSAVRQELGIEEGDELAVVVDEDGVRFMDRARLIRRIREGFSHVEHSLSGELMEERRSEAARDLD